LTIGRKTDNDVVIDNMAVSSHHARIVMQGTSYLIEDTQSTNGTFLNEQKVMSAALKHNDQILIGQHMLVFLQPEETTQAAAEPQQKVIDSEATVIIDPTRQQQILSDAAAKPTKVSSPAAELTGVLRVLEGKAEQQEYILTSLLTYIGKSSSAAIRLKGFFAPDIAALVSKRPAGYLFTAVKEGYPKLNNGDVIGQMELKDGDLIDVGGLKLLFQLKEIKQEQQ
jgi:pSer/pThr/pTyr-binding forkhead associated (FHA) protein